MSHLSATESVHHSKPKAPQHLKAIKVSLLIFLLGMCVVNKRKSTWPLVSWALYSGYSVRFRTPEPMAFDVELRVYTTDGNRYTVNPEDILTVPRDSLSYKIVEQAFVDISEVDAEDVATELSARDESRVYLVRSLRDLLSTEAEIQTIEFWQRSYEVEAQTVPPIQIGSPSGEVMLGKLLY